MFRLIRKTRVGRETVRYAPRLVGQRDCVYVEIKNFTSNTNLLTLAKMVQEEGH